MAKAKVAILVGSDSDLPVVSAAAQTLSEFGVPFSITVSSAHRSPKRTITLIESYHKNGVKIIVAAAGLAAHLGGVVAAHFPLPVIGIPLRGGALNGVDSLYSTVQMPPGIPVATVGIDSAQNAGLLAIQMLAISDKKLENKFILYKETLSKKVDAKAKKLEKIGLSNYINENTKNS